MKELMDKLIESGALRLGEFILSSGKRSSYYIDIKKASTKYEVLDLMGELLSSHVKGDILAGVELGAIPLVAVTAIKSRRNYLIIRKERKAHGTLKLIEGDFKKGQEVDIIEDVVTTGQSVLRAIKILRNEGLHVRRVICVVDREEGGREQLNMEGVELIPLLRARELIK